MLRALERSAGGPAAQPAASGSTPAPTAHSQPKIPPQPATGARAAKEAEVGGVRLLSRDPPTDPHLPTSRAVRPAYMSTTRTASRTASAAAGIKDPSRRLEWKGDGARLPNSSMHDYDLLVC